MCHAIQVLKISIHDYSVIKYPDIVMDYEIILFQYSVKINILLKWMLAYVIGLEY